MDKKIKDNDSVIATVSKQQRKGSGKKFGAPVKTEVKKEEK